MYLNCHTYYSLRYGMMPVDKLVQKAKEAGAGAIALTDINNSTGIPDFSAECSKQGIRPIAGIEFRNGNDLQYIGLARNNKGLQELNEFLSDLNFKGTPVPFPAPAFDHSYIIYSQSYLPSRKLYNNERIGIRPSELSRLISMPYDRDRMVILRFEHQIARCRLQF